MVKEYKTAQRIKEMATKKQAKTAQGIKQMATTKKPKIEFETSQEVVDSFKTLAKNSGMTQAVLFKAMLDKYMGESIEDLDENPSIEFSFTGEDRKEKEPLLREIFGLNERDNVVVSEKDLVKKACELEKATFESLTKEGRILAAKNKIGRHIQIKLGKGKIGKADERLIQHLRMSIETDTKLTVNKLVEESKTFRPTVIKFLTEKNIQVDGSVINRESILEFLEEIK